MGMAKRKYSSRSKIEPAVTNVTVTLEPGFNYIDLSQIASIVNRRFYRQGINWAVAGFKAYKPTPTESGAIGIVINKLPNTWVLANAWTKSFKTWQKMNRNALEESPTVRPKFLDFKIYMDERHHQAGFIANLTPQDSAGVLNVDYNPATGRYEGLGEWESSKASIPLVSPAGTFLPGETAEREFIATGANYPGVSPVTGFNAISLIEGYAASRLLPNILDPNTPDDANDVGGGTPENWMSAIFNEGTDQDADVLSDMITENNTAPYPFENGPIVDAVAPNALEYSDTQYPGGANQLPNLELVDVAYFNAGTNANTLRLKGDNFPCGLIQIVNGASDQVGLIIDLIPGRHRGYMCEPMLEM